MDSLKTYLIEVVLRKYGPAFIKGAVTMLFAYLGAHQGILNSRGITWDAGGHTLDIDFDVLAGGVWQSLLALMAGTGSLMAMFSAIQHHTVATVKGQPQDGDHQRSTDVTNQGDAK